MNIAIGCDEAAVELKESIKLYIMEKGYKVTDYSVNDDEKPALYPDIAVKASKSIAGGENERGILFCGTGIGMAISANKVPGIRATVCHDTYSSERAIRSNNAQIITMGARVIGVELAKKVVDAWLESTFDGGKSLPKVNKIIEYEKQFSKEEYIKQVKPVLI